MPTPEPHPGRSLLGHPLGLLALGFGTGLSPLAPGTVASLAAWAVWAAALPADPAPRFAALALCALLAWPAATFALRRLCHRDPRMVVVDEWLGMWCALALSPPGLLGEGAAFLLFRLLDVLKPWPIARLERLPGALGVIADDLAAGVAAGGAVAAAAAFLPRFQGG